MSGVGCRAYFANLPVADINSSLTCRFTGGAGQAGFAVGFKLSEPTKFHPFLTRERLCVGQDRQPRVPQK